MHAAPHVTVEQHTWAEQDGWAEPDGRQALLFTLASAEISVSLCNFGARIVSVFAPDRAGQRANVVLGFAEFASYLTPPNAFFGCTAGRFANRIAHGRFTLDGRTYSLPVNNGANTLHGGPEGFDQRFWTAEIVDRGVEFSLTSPHGDMGFPGTLHVTVRYTLSGSALHIEYTATTDQATVANLTNHAYFNLAGESHGSVLDHRVQIDADSFLPTDATSIPLGEPRSVAATAFDFRTPHAIGERITANDEQLHLAHGYDHNFVLNGAGLRAIASVFDPVTGRSLTVQTDQPGVQFYSGNFLLGEHRNRAGRPYLPQAGFCLETQHFPDSPNRPAYPDTTLRPAETLHSTTIYSFGVRQ
jgi:aldose 1-epimerase